MSHAIHSQTKKTDHDIVFLSLTKEQFVHIAYPLIAGIPTAILILYFFDFGQIYRDILNNLVSPVITGVVSGFVLYMLGIKR